MAIMSSPSPSPSPSAEWDTLGNTEAFYRRTLLYSLDLVLPGGGDLSDYLLAGARNGGPFAITRDDSKPVLLKEASSASAAEGSGSGRNRKRVWVYTSAGILIQSIIVRRAAAVQQCPRERLTERESRHELILEWASFRLALAVS